MFFTTRAELSRVAQRDSEVLQEFIRRKCGEKKLSLRLHAIWYGL